MVNDQCTLCGACAEECPEGAITLPGKSFGGRSGTLSGSDGFCRTTSGRLAEVTFELLHKGRELADTLKVSCTGGLVGEEVSAPAGSLIEHGADRVYVVDHPSLEGFTDELYGECLTRIIRTYRPEIVLAGATSIGRSFIPKVATQIGTGLTADCTELSHRPGKNVFCFRPVRPLAATLWPPLSAPRGGPKWPRSGPRS